MAVIGNAPFQGLVSGGNIIDASIEGVDLSTSAIAARLGYTPVDPGAATFTANTIINDNSANAALRITQTGAGNALLVEDSASTDSTPFVITAAGDVGIGSTSPVAKLEVAGSNNSTWSATSTTISGTTMTIAGTVTGTIAIGDLIYGTGVQPYTRITAGSGLSWTVSVSQTVASTTIYGTSLYGGTLIRIVDTDSSVVANQPQGGLQFYGSDSSSPTAGVGAYVAAITESNIPDTALVFGTRDNGIGGVDANERIRIDSLGNVGIGTNSPVARLEVAGSNSGIWSAATSSISGVTLTVGAVTNGTIAIGDIVFGTGVQPYTRITAGSGSTWTVSVSQTVAPVTLTGGATYANTLIRITDTDTVVNTTQPTGGLQFFTSDSSSPTAGVGAYVAAVAESTSPDIALVFGTRDNGGGGVDANERIRIDSLGNVGIGTTSPSANLEISNAGNATLRLTAGNTSSSIIQLGDTDDGNVGEITYSHSTNSMVFDTNDVERMRIDSNGNLGVGLNTSPSTGKFSDASYAFLIQSLSTSTGTNIFASNSDNSKFVGFWSGHSGAEPAVGVKTGNAFTFGKWAAINGTGGFTENMRIDSSGNLGIGTANPQVKLHVFQRSDAGAAPSTPEIRIEHQDINAIGTGGSAGGVLSFVNIQRDNTGWAADKIWGRINFSPSQPTGGVAQLGASILAAADGAIGGLQSASYLAFHTSDYTNGGNTGEKMRISANGNVGIGTTAPTTKLSVDGKIYSSEGMPFNSELTGTVTTNGSGDAIIYVPGWGWADFTSYRKIGFVMAAITNAANTDFGTWTGLLQHGQSATIINNSTFRGSTGANWAFYFGSNGSTGQRYFYMAGAAASTVYTYTIRAFSPSSLFIGSYGGI
jgi:ribosomal protein S11